MAKAEAKYTIRAEDQTAKGIRSAETRLERFRRRSIGALRGGLTRLAGPLAAVGAAIAGWGAVLDRTTGKLDNLAKTAKDLGTDAATARALQLGAELQGSNLNQVARVLERMAVATNEAVDGVKEYADVFDELGIVAERFAQLDPLQKLAVAGQQLQAAPDSRRVGLTRQLAGRGTGRLFSGDVAGSFGEADRLALTRDAAKNAAVAEAYQDAMTRNAAVFGDIVDRAALVLAPLLTSAANASADALTFGRAEPRGTSGSFSLAERSAIVTELKKIKRNTDNGIGARFK